MAYGRVNVGGGGATIKSIQRGELYIGSSEPTTRTVTINQIDKGKSIARISFEATNAHGIQIKILNPTTLEISSPSEKYENYTVYWEVIEFLNIKQVISKTDYFTSRSTGFNERNILLPNDLNIEKSIMFWSGYANQTFNNSNIPTLSGQRFYEENNNKYIKFRVRTIVEPTYFENTFFILEFN